jgi:hypothetical protein
MSPSSGQFALICGLLVDAVPDCNNADAKENNAASLHIHSRIRARPLGLREQPIHHSLGGDLYIELIYLAILHCHHMFLSFGVIFIYLNYAHSKSAMNLRKLEFKQ